MFYSNPFFADGLAASCQCSVVQLSFARERQVMSYKVGVLFRATRTLRRLLQRGSDELRLFFVSKGLEESVGKTAALSTTTSASNRRAYAFATPMLSQRLNQKQLLFGSSCFCDTLQHSRSTRAAKPRRSWTLLHEDFFACAQSYCQQSCQPVSLKV